MTGQDELQRKHGNTRFSQAMNQSVHPMAVAAASIFIVGFFLLVIVAQQFPSHWFVQRFLAGYKLFVAIILLAGIVIATLAAIENRMLKRRAEEHRESDLN